MLLAMASVVITGATGGIGSALVRLFTERGDDVVAVSRPSAALEALCEETKAVGAPLDLLRPTSLPPALADLPVVDGLVHAAGTSEVLSVEDTSYEVWQETMAVNVTGPAELTRGLLPALRAAQGRVVFVNAVAGLHAVPRWAAYAGSKAALTELADSLRLEESVNGVRVTSIYPGGIATEMLRKVRAGFGSEFDRARLVSPESFAVVVASLFDMPPDVDVHEIALKPPPVVR
jgi:NAD(P)-dependent dehydrogenase (short-subunit alcohol dehydrogenase family)